MFGGIGSGAYVAFSMRQREIEEEEEARWRRRIWNSYTEEQKQAILEYERKYREYKEKREQEQYEKFCNILKKLLIPFSYVKDKIWCLIIYYYCLIFKLCYNIRTDYMITLKTDINEYCHVYGYKNYFYLNDYQLVGKILINTHNINFRKLKQMILMKYKDYESRKIYLKKIFNECKFIKDEDIDKLNKIFKNDLVKRY